jgi:hypothetical protein
MRTDTPEKIHDVELPAREGNNIDQDNEDYPHNHEDAQQKFRNGYLDAEEPRQDKDPRGNGADRKAL